MEDSNFFGLLTVVVYLSIIALLLAGMWRVFEKAGHPGWAAIIPIYNSYILCKIAGKPGWWVLLMLIPIVNFVILLLISLEVSTRFGKSSGFAIGLWLLPIVFFPILGFGSARYMAAPAAAAPAPA